MQCRKIVTVILAVASFGLFPQSVFAQSLQPPVVTPVYPSNQNPNIKGYFDLAVAPGHIETIHVRIANQNPMDMAVSIRPANAYTNPKGGIYYDIHADSANSTIIDDRFRLATHLKAPSSVILKPHKSIDVPIIVTVPNIKVGTVVGGVQFVTQGSTNTKTQRTEKGKANFILKTENVFSMAVELDLPTSAKSNLSFGNAGFNPDTGLAYIVMTNNAPMIQRNISGTYQIFGGDGRQIVKGTFPIMDMAPKTQIRYPLNWPSSTLTPGTYQLNVNSILNGDSTRLSRTFSIGSQQVNQYKSQHPATVVQQSGTPMWIWGLIVLCIVIIAILMFMLGRWNKQ